MDVGWVKGVSLNDVQDADVAGGLAWCDRNHAIFRLEKSAHHVENSGFADCFGLRNIIAGERSIGCHKEVAAGSWYETGDYANEVIVHITWVSEGGSTGRHDS